MRQRRFLTIVYACVAPLLVGRWANGQNDPPANYYSTATGTGATLKSQLHDIIDGHTSLPYSGSDPDTRRALQITDADPAQPGYMLTVYDRMSLELSTIGPVSGIAGWDGGATWNREHTWPRSRGVGSSGPDDSDLFNLRPSFTENNSDRANLNYGGSFGQPFGVVSGGQYYYPGDADAGMIARQAFYMAVRYDGSDANTTDLELFVGNPSTSQGMGDLSRLIEWHFAAPPDEFERRRNQVIYDDYQHNRNPFIDRPEFAWSVFMNNTNDSRIAIAGATVNADGSSTQSVDLGRVLVGGAVPAPQSFTLNKLGNDGTYYEVTTVGAATSTVTGRLNAFRTGSTGTQAIDIGLNTTTSTAGLRTGTVTVDNLDVTTGGGAGRGANDANDTLNVSLAVLDHATGSFASDSTTTTLTHDFGVVTMGSMAPTFSLDLFNREGAAGFTADLDLDGVLPSGSADSLAALTTNLAASAGHLSLDAGTSQQFTTTLDTSVVGSFSATYTLSLSDEDLPGALDSILTLSLMGEVTAALLTGDYNRDGAVDAADYVMWRNTFGTSVAPYEGADGDGSGMIDDEDYPVWASNFGMTAGPPVGAEPLTSATAPEPGEVWLGIVGVLTFASGWRRRSS